MLFSSSVQLLLNAIFTINHCLQSAISSINLSISSTICLPLLLITVPVRAIQSFTSINQSDTIFDHRLAGRALGGMGGRIVVAYARRAFGACVSACGARRGVAAMAMSAAMVVRGGATLLQQQQHYNRSLTTALRIAIAIAAVSTASSSNAVI